MALNARKEKGTGGKSFPPVEAGTYPARLVQVIDLGVQEQRPFKGQEKPPAHEVSFTYELVDEFLPDEDGNEDKEKPRWQSEIIPVHNLEADKAKSTKRYYALDPEEEKGGDFAALIGTPVMITLVNNENNGKVYTNITGTSTMRAKEAAKCPPLVNEPKVLDLDEPDVEVFKSLPQFIQDKITGGLEFEGSKLDTLLKGGKAEAKEDEAPFDHGDMGDEPEEGKVDGDPTDW